MQAAIVRGVETGLRHHLLRVRPVPIARGDARADGAAVRCDADKQDLEPVPPPETSLRSSDGGSFMFITSDVHVAVVVEIAERTAAAGVQRRDATASFLDQFLEAAVAQIAKHESRRLERIRGQRSFHFRIDAAGDEEQVRKPIVVQIDDARSPAD